MDIGHITWAVSIVEKKFLLNNSWKLSMTIDIFHNTWTFLINSHLLIGQVNQVNHQLIKFLYTLTPKKEVPGQKLPQKMFD
jgi:hypothetical protein